MARFGLYQNTTKHNNAQILDLDELCMAISKRDNFISQITCQWCCLNYIFTNKMKFWTENIAVILVLLHKQARGAPPPHPPTPPPPHPTPPTPPPLSDKNSCHMYEQTICKKIVIALERCYLFQHTWWICIVLCHEALVPMRKMTSVFIKAVIASQISKSKTWHAHMWYSRTIDYRLANRQLVVIMHVGDVVVKYSSSGRSSIERCCFQVAVTARN